MQTNKTFGGENNDEYSNLELFKLCNSNALKVLS